MANWNETTSALGFSRLFEEGRADPREVTEFFLERTKKNDPDHRVYRLLTETRARAEADAAADRAKRGLRRHALDGVPLSWKDLFDSAGDVTPAGSLALRTRIPTRDAEVLARATRAGAICLGKTNMTEIAFSGLGINPKMGTPANAFDEAVERVPGGSSSGAAVSVARGLAAGAIGTDTGGSVRIPSAWNGLVGLKTTAGRIPLGGTVPLSPSFDTIGPLAHDVADAAALFSLLNASKPFELEGVDLNNVVLWLPGGVGWSDLDEGVATALDLAIRRLVHAGARIVEHKLPELDEIDALAWGGGASRLVAEAYAIWHETLATNEAVVYRPVFERMMAGVSISAADLLKSDTARRDIAARYLAATAGIDAVLLPTVAITPPPIAALEAGGPDYFKANRMALRNTTIGNQLGLCAITLPAGYDAAGIPVGLMLQAAPNTEEKLLRIARAVEKVLK
ncbi:amidase [Parvibaculum sedimenti]|uniref:Indoleacetamide hydrolase n=1 Tax=Parvibaculum sedimenti TaxID=2608632 RepID=A0A6N6VLL7_9HYPH|nr:amidase family protein [Parvibaculum sedimenti]KAB7742326.1 amidase [Parvibaculum sedimenti]